MRTCLHKHMHRRSSAGKKRNTQWQKSHNISSSGSARQKQLAALGVNVVNERIVIDGNVITSYCPETAPHVAFELLRKLVGTEKMLPVKAAMGY